MASNSRCGLSTHQRVSYMRENGYVQADSGKGSHDVWINTEMQETAKKYRIEMPANLRSSNTQPACTVIVPCDPGRGTWAAIKGQVEWCNRTLTDIAKREAVAAEQRAAREERAKQSKLKRAFHSAARRWAKAGQNGPAPTIAATAMSFAAVKR